MGLAGCDGSEGLVAIKPSSSLEDKESKVKRSDREEKRVSMIMIAKGERGGHHYQLLLLEGERMMSSSLENNGHMRVRWRDQGERTCVCERERDWYRGRGREGGWVRVRDWYRDGS